jgi:quinol monooxygenase YgiN
MRPAMIVIAGEVQVRPEKREEAMHAALEMIAETLKEPGCRAYRFSTALDDPSRIHIFEEWDSMDALGAHFQSPHMAKFQAVLPGVLAAPPRLARYEVASKGDF